MVEMWHGRDVVKCKRLGVRIDHAILNVGAAGKVLSCRVIAKVRLKTEDWAEDMTHTNSEPSGRVGRLFQRRGSRRGGAGHRIDRSVASGGRSKRSVDIDVNVSVFYD